jgi:hypothetical protein
LGILGVAEFDSVAAVDFEALEKAPTVGGALVLCLPTSDLLSIAFKSLRLAELEVSAIKFLSEPATFTSKADFRSLAFNEY